jgi:hypothetical protein
MAEQTQYSARAQWATPPAFSLFRGVRRQATGGRWEVTQADLDMYRMITGRAASADERADDGELSRASAPVMARRTWSPTVLYCGLREFCSSTSLRLRVVRPQVATWVRRVSGDARRRFAAGGNPVGTPSD